MVISSLLSHVFGLSPLMKKMNLRKTTPPNFGQVIEDSSWKALPKEDKWDGVKEALALPKETHNYLQMMLKLPAMKMHFRKRNEFCLWGYSEECHFQIIKPGLKILTITGTQGDMSL